MSGRKWYLPIEFVLVTALAYFLSIGLKGFSLTYWIDFRLLMVVALSLTHGTVAGIASAIIASALLFLSHESYNPQLFLYNTENWIPFAVYIIVGAVLGNSTDKYRDGRKTADDKLALAERTARRITDLCEKAVREKDGYRDQILGYKESYGRIYSIVQKLNSEETERVLSSAVDALADVLDNDTAAIYFVSGDKRHARLAVRAKGFITADFPRSVALGDYKKIMEKALRRELWFNQSLLPGYPAYCAPMYDGGRLIALAIIQRASAAQMTLQYCDLIKILSGLIQESIIRAEKFTRLRMRELYSPDTRILLEEPFARALLANVALAEQEKAEIELIVVRRTAFGLSVDNDILESSVREDDMFGIINRRLIGIILKHAFHEGAAAVQDRLKKWGMIARPVTVRQMQQFIYRERGELV